MEKRIFLLLCLSCMLAGCEVQGQSFGIYYIGEQDGKVLLENETFYDVEEKPTVFYIQKEGVDKGIYIVEVYRIIDSERHFYKSFILNESNMEKGFDVTGIFTDITSPFINTSGFVLTVCRTDKQHYPKLKRKDECDLSDEFKVLLEE